MAYINRQQLFEQVEYPLRYKPGNLVKASVVLFSIAFFFLLLFEPFGVYRPEQKFNYLIICGLHALSPTLIFYIYFSALNYSRKRNAASETSSWTMFQEYAHIAVILLLVGIASFLMRDFIYDNPYNWSLRYFWEEIRNCYLVGCLVYILLTFANFYFRSKSNSAQALLFPISRDTENTAEAITEIFIKTQVKQDDFSFIATQLLFAKAEGNYVELTLCSNSSVTTELKRISLKQFESQIAAHPFFFRCHRAYLVNMAQIEKVTGNSQGYLLSFNGTADKVPVSRAQLNSFNGLYQQLRVA
ncbi:LytR/AlgR family response regulator transcription factor [Mucilaginibacter jinjuensis]|uniref:LytTR family DNA-binding domain-containing protein n=1 Tax=Mucilaginibacter jinjuensis TaxID=1176721 RepID=A0ABY7TAY9_9SPHI|nr:LytTR family DNA-binding domain-containing protein [Mucilaginibacter jinjuensis]WCT13101.1 LytTR family DNA-binding domain-containing protein [Mucilaginibacter jinjuensis]